VGVRGGLRLRGHGAVSLVSDADEEAALKLIADGGCRWPRSPLGLLRCGEEIEGQFDSCWRCAGASS